jgi:hypothetical protein
MSQLKMLRTRLLQFDRGLSWVSYTPGPAVLLGASFYGVDNTCAPTSDSSWRWFARSVATRSEEDDPRVSVAYADSFSARYVRHHCYAAASAERPLYLT